MVIHYYYCYCWGLLKRLFIEVRLDCWAGTEDFNGVNLVKYRYFVGLVTSHLGLLFPCIFGIIKNISIYLIL